MFRKLAADTKPEGFITHSEFVQGQNNFFENKLGKTFLTGMGSNAATVLSNAASAIGVFDPNTRTSGLRDIDISKYATSLNVSQELIDAQNACKAMSNIDVAINTVDISSRFRCGWIYKKGSPGNIPAVSEAALGSMNGPATFLNNPSGTWYWNLEDAKKAILTDRCSALTNCANVGSTNFADCGFSTEKNTGIPVTQLGTAMYPNDSRYNSPANKIVLNSSSCPPPPPPGSPLAQYQQSVDVCVPQANGKLRRDCMLQQITAAGCKTDGQLYIALASSAQPNNYAAGLANSSAYTKYQQNAVTPLLDNVMRDGSTTAAIALGNFTALNNEAKTVSNTAVNYAARDLCLKKGTYDSFDFCSEITDTTRGPYPLECLQREFRKAGGQPAGTAYPTAATKASWDALATWSAVRSQINSLAVGTASTVEATQRANLTAFLGINRQPYGLPQIQKMPGTEVFWVNAGTNTFIGRRIKTGADVSFPSFRTAGQIIENTGLADNVDYICITNIRPVNDTRIRLSLRVDDIAVYSLGKTPDTNMNDRIDTSSEFGSSWTQGTKDAANCWTLRANGPNYITGVWKQAGGPSESRVYYSLCDQNNFQLMPSAWFNLTQEPDAPMISFQGVSVGSGASATPAFRERRLFKTLGLNASAQTSVITNTDLTRIPKIPALLKLRGSTGNANGFAETTRNFGAFSWRTLTCCFIPVPKPECAFNAAGYSAMYPDLQRAFNGNATQLLEHWNTFGKNEGRIPCGLNGAYKIMEFGPIGLYMNGGKFWFKYQSSTITIQSGFSLTIPNNNTNPYYFILNMASDTQGALPNRITFSIGTVDDWKSGAVKFGQPSPNRGSWTTSGAPVTNATESHKLYLGDKDTQFSADCAIAFVRLFDYELNNDDVLRDINGTWKMEFVNE